MINQIKILTVEQVKEYEAWGIEKTNLHKGESCFYTLYIHGGGKYTLVITAYSNDDFRNEITYHVKGRKNLVDLCNRIEYERDLKSVHWPPVKAKPDKQGYYMNEEFDCGFSIIDDEYEKEFIVCAFGNSAYDNVELCRFKTKQQAKDFIAMIFQTYKLIKDT